MIHLTENLIEQASQNAWQSQNTIDTDYEEVQDSFYELTVGEALEIINDALVHGFEFYIENYKLYVKM